MNPQLAGVWERMRSLGLETLGHANHHAVFTNYVNLHWKEIAVIQAAHAGEILIKARIAQEHPLLIFDRLPETPIARSGNLEFDDLFDRAKAISWSQLPGRLWAVTGIRLPNVKRFESFGRLRNSILHFAPPESRDSSHEALRFIFEVIDPFINDSWGLFAIDYHEDIGTDEYFAPGVAQHEIPFLVSPQLAHSYYGWDDAWDGTSEQYRAEMTKRVTEAHETSSPEAS